MNFFDGFAGALLDGDDIVRAEEVFDSVVGVAVGGGEIDGDVFLGNVREKVVDPMSGRRRRAADAETRVDGFQRASGVIVEFELSGLLGVAGPEVDVGLVPDFEIPLRDFVDAVAVDQKLREVVNEEVPL